MTAPVPAVTDDQSPAPQDAPVLEATPVRVIPDRADAPVSEVTERFLRAVIATVPVELIEELHLFSPLRQGTVETGIAVLAARVPVAVVEERAGEPELPFVAEAGEAGEIVEALDVEAPSVEAPGVEAPGVEALGVEALDVDAPDVEATGVEAPDVEAPEADAPTGELEVVADAGDDDEDVSVVEQPHVEASADESDEANAVSEVPAVKAERPVRHTVYTARYRYVIKGPERGKWESNIKDEADAPLITVETVVRGVQRRAGEESEIVRYSGAQIARALRIPYPA
jgi:hypothetical protein